MDTTTPVEAVGPSGDSAQLAALERQLAASNKQLQVDQAATGKNAATVATLSTIAAQIAVLQAEIAQLNATMADAAPNDRVKLPAYRVLDPSHARSRTDPKPVMAAAAAGR